MKAVSATTVAPGHNRASAPNTIAARPRNKNSHQWWRTEAAISSASISTSTCAGDLETGAVYGHVVGLQKSLEMGLDRDVHTRLIASRQPQIDSPAAARTTNGSSIIT